MIEAHAHSSVVVPTLVADQVYDALSNKIFSGELAAGSRLRVRDLAEEVGTSVMPVRDALRQLVENGLAVTTPYRGARVREFTTSELIQIYDVRSILEVEATRQGAPRITTEQLSRMRESCERMRQAVANRDVTRALDEDEALLRHLYAAGGNRVLVSTIESLWRQCRAYKVIGARVAIERRDESLWSAQPLLIRALEDGEADRAVAINRESVAAAQRRLETVINA